MTQTSNTAATLRWKARIAAGAVRRDLQAAPGRARDGAWAAPSVAKVLPYTMLRPVTLFSLVTNVQNIARNETQGSIVECGVWRGGASFLMADVLRRLGDARMVWMFDSFEGMPPKEPIDGEAALQWEQEDDPWTNNATASLEEVAATRDRLRLEGNTRLVKGWFEDTLPDAEVESIALLRIDADWHSTVSTCLRELYDRVSPGGVVIFDDYYTFDGCAVAVHEFLGGRSLRHALVTDHGTAFFVKS